MLNQASAALAGLFTEADKVGGLACQLLSTLVYHCLTIFPAAPDSARCPLLGTHVVGTPVCHHQPYIQGINNVYAPTAVVSTCSPQASVRWGPCLRVLRRLQGLAAGLSSNLATLKRELALQRRGAVVSLLSRQGSIYADSRGCEGARAFSTGCRRDTSWLLRTIAAR